MALRRLLAIAIIVSLYSVAWGANAGGCWLIPRKIGFTAGMGTTPHNSYSMRSSASSLLSVNYKTVMTIDAGDSVYTMGLGYADSTFYDTTHYYINGLLVDTTALYLDGYVGQSMQVSAFFLGTAADTFTITVEQALRYDEAMGDSGYSYGFIVTDTLFTDNFNATRDTCFVATVSAQGKAERLLNDSFDLTMPCVRLKVRNQGNTSGIDVNFELYARHKSDVLSGVAGRLNQNLEVKLKPLRGRMGLR